jgi:peptide/nickel transport system substrate-binding protein
MAEYVEGSSITYTKNPNYWSFDEKFPENRLPYVDEMRFVFMTETATKIAALRTAKVDIQGSLTYALKNKDDMERLQRTNPEIVITEHPNRSDYGIGMNTQKAPFDDIRVRKAMQMALDRETLHNTYFKGWGSWTPHSLLANDMPVVGTAFEEWPEQLKKLYDYDPTEAERLLDEAGYPRGADGIRFKLTMAHYELTDLDYAELVSKTYFRDIGVEVEVIPVAGADWAATVSAAEWDFFGGMTMAGRYQDPSGFLGQHTTGASANRCQCADPVYDALFEEASKASTRAEILPLYKKLNDRLRDQVYFVWGQETPLYSVQQPWIKGRNGEYVLGSNVESVIMARLWVDQELKEAMGY